MPQSLAPCFVETRPELRHVRCTTEAQPREGQPCQPCAPVPPLRQEVIPMRWLVVLAALVFALDAHGATFAPLGDLPGGSFRSTAGAVSADGSTVVGSSASGSGTEAFRWTAATGMVGLGDLPDGVFSSEAIDVSADGSVVVGTGHGSGGSEAFRWTTPSGLLGLGAGPQPQPDFLSAAHSVSADGSTVVGFGNQWFTWTEARGMVPVPYGPGFSFITDDGSVVVSWPDAGGDTYLCTPSGCARLFPEVYIVLDMSADGLFVGVQEHYQFNSVWNIFLAVPFPDLPFVNLVEDGPDFSCGYIPHAGTYVYVCADDVLAGSADLVSPDGTAVVGTVEEYSRFGGPSGQSAVVWDSIHGNTVGVTGTPLRSTVVGRPFAEGFFLDAANGQRSVTEVLNGLGIDLSGWMLTTIKEASADGRVIIGTGTNPSGQTEAWLVKLVSECGDGLLATDESCDDGNTAAGDGCSATCTVEPPECSDGIDNDGDGLADLADPGCADAADLDEHSPTLPCDDGADNDGDGRSDYLAAGGGDPGCLNPNSLTENPQCQDGLDNDYQTGIDFDGGDSLDIGPRDGLIDAQFNAAKPAVGAADPQCVGKPWANKEQGGCGLGAELAFVMPLLGLAASRRRRAS